MRRLHLNRPLGQAASAPSCQTLFLAMLLTLGGCTATAPAASVPSTAPEQWYAPVPSGTAAPAATNSLPHQGSLAKLSLWWQQQNDPLLVELIEAAQAVSPSVLAARAHIEQAQAARAASLASLLPTFDAVANINRSRPAPMNQMAVTPSANAQAGLQTHWELDLFGKNWASLEAEQDRVQGSQALWHEARVSVAAELANQYYSRRACEKLLLISTADMQSRLETARLTALLAKAGFEAPANAALARASAAESTSRLTQQRALCDIDVKVLVALTALPEPVLRQKLAQTPTDAPLQNIAEISSVPADVLAQRPDVFNAARQVSAASFEVGSAQALRYPRLSLTGSIETNQARTRSTNQSYNTWSIGPLVLTMPLFDAGASQANLEATKARYEEAVGQYHSTVRQAVREVEEALIHLQSTAARSTDTAITAEGYRLSLAGIEARYKAGLASLMDFEESRRLLLTAQSAVVTLDKERRSAWIALYRALGGGWTAAALDTTSISSEMPTPASPSWQSLNK